LPSDLSLVAELEAFIFLPVGLGGLGVEKDDVVVIKPNAKNQSPPGYGIVTDSQVVEALVSLSFRAGAKRVKIADGAAYPTGAYDTMAAFETMSMTKIAEKWDVDLVDLNGYDSLDADVPNGLVLDWVSACFPPSMNFSFHA